MAAPPATDDGSAPNDAVPPDDERLVAASPAFRWFGWIPGRGFAFAVVFALIAGAAIAALCVAWSAEVELLRVGGDARVVPAEAVKDACPTTGDESAAQDATRRVAHARVAIWNRSVKTAEEPGEETFGLAARLLREPPSHLPRELSVARQPGETNLRVRWVGIAARTAMRDDMQRVTVDCDAEFVRVVWNGLAPRAGFLVEAMIALPDGADAADLVLVPVPLPAGPDGRRAGSPRAPTFVPVASASVPMNAERSDVAAVRWATLGALWLVSLLAAGAMAHRAACDALFGFRAAALAWSAGLAGCLALGLLVLAPRALLLLSFPRALLPG